ncbi:uncharacterized protein LOC135331428 isoform X2 [Halichondria panicea]|uniref:uncharacterized protein LOC135331428 isoform X2 n=1 Tax=Halichondria panicea TaxID=6063 RepID=UPI00312B51D8
MKTVFLLVLINICTGMPVSRVQRSSSDADQPSRLCSSGPAPLHEAAIVTSKSERGIIYVDPLHPVTCEGRVDMIEACYTVNNNFAGGYSIDLVVLRPISDGYVLQQELDLPIVQASLGNVLSCQNFTVPSVLSVEDGDLVGFRAKNKIEIAFTLQGSIQSVNIQPILGESTQAEQLRVESRSRNEFPMFRAFIDSDVDGGEQWPELNFDNTYNTIFTSFVIASAAAVLIIVLLLLCTCYLGKGLCQERHQCLYKICCCCFSGQKKKNKKGLIRRVINV